MLFDDNFAGIIMFVVIALMFSCYEFGKFMAEYKHENEQKRGRK